MERLDGAFFENAYLCDVAVMSGVRKAGRSVDYETGRRSHGLLYIWEGEACFEPQDAPVLIAYGGELVFLPDQKKYRMTYVAPSTTFVLVNFHMYQKNGAPCAPFSEISVLAKEDPSGRIVRIMSQLEICGSVQTAGAVLRKRELLYRLLGVACAADHVRPDQPNARLAAGVRLLEESYLESLPIEQMAKASCMSVNTFRRLFHKQYGQSPVEYRNALRIERAKVLLADGGYSVAEAAYASGFSNVGYFCRCYRNLTGQTPGEFKKQDGSN